MQPLSFVPVPHDGCFLDEDIVYSFVIQRRRFGTSVRLVMHADVLGVCNSQGSGVTDLSLSDALEITPIRTGCKFRYIRRGAISKDESSETGL